MYNPFSLEGKTVLVTGASSGIGRATAVECSKLGAKLILTARNEVRLNETLNMLEGNGHQMILADLTKPSDIDQLVEKSSQLDGLVNDAGVGVIKPVTFIKQLDLEYVVGTNTFAPILLTGAMIKKKKLNKNASIVFVSSVSSMSVNPGNSVYGISKSAIKTFAEYCALEVKNKGFRVNSVHPGMVETAMTQNPPLSASEKDLDKTNYIMKRYGRPEEIAWAIAYLLSDATQWVTGSQLVIDGGMHL